MKCVKILKLNHLWKGFLYRTRHWQHQLQTEKMKGDYPLLLLSWYHLFTVLAYWSSSSEQMRKSRDCTSKVNYFNSNLLPIKKINSIGYSADQILNSTELQEDWQQAN